MEKYPNEVKGYDGCKYIFFAKKKLSEKELKKAMKKHTSKYPNLEIKRNQTYEIDYESLWE